MTSVEAAAALSGLLVLTGSQRRWARLLSPLARVSPVNLAAGAAQVSGWWLALQVATAQRPVPRPHTPWHALASQEVLRRLGEQAGGHRRHRPEGLDRAREVFATVVGLPAAAPLGLTVRLAGAIRAELNDPLTPILAVGAAASAILGSTMDAVLVLGVNASVGGVQRLRAEHALRALAACTCRKHHPCRSSGRSILVDDSAKTILPTYGEAIDPFSLEGLGQGLQRCCRRE
jgi:cation-transporting ATPase I